MRSVNRLENGDITGILLIFLTGMLYDRPVAIAILLEHRVVYRQVFVW